MRAFIIQISIGLLTLIVPEIWKDTFDWLRRSQYWRYIQLAVVLWILVVISLCVPWSAIFQWALRHRLIGAILLALIAAVLFGGGFFLLSPKLIALGSDAARKWNKADLAINQMSGCTIEIPEYTIRSNPLVGGQSNNEPEPPSEGPNIFSEEFKKMFITVGNNIIELPNSNDAKVPLFVIDNVGSLALDGIGIVDLRAGGSAKSIRNSTIPAISFIESGKVFVDAEIYAGLGRPPMHVRRNHISDRPADWDENSDKTHAIEIVNAEQIPVLQIIYPDKAHAIIKGVFSAGAGLVVIADDDGLWTFREQDGSKFPIKRLFKYPSWKYRGLFEESMQPSPTPNKEASPH